MSKKRVYVVPHSHWDREWYFTIEDSNILLAENLDHLLELLEQHEEYHGYVFDAQMSIVDEYLKVRPDNKERLKRLIEQKRIFVGPWYTQADSLLVHKESLVRNLLYGVKGTETMGHSMNVGYLPDIFGQNTYLPALFHDFDIDYAILQRGIYSDQLDGNTNFLWESPDGKSVKANLIPLGYGPGKFLNAEKEFHQERLQPMLEKLAKMNKDTDNLLLPAGGDQVLVREHFPKTIQQLNAQDEQYDYVLSDYETFMEDTWEEGDFDHTITGELIGTENSRIHNTIRSQRYDIKQWNSFVEHKMINQLEPLAVIGKQLGLRYPQEWLDIMWKNLFDVHAHDSIGGCNSDDTNKDIMHRLEKINRQADGLLNLIKKQLTHAIASKLKEDDIVVLFNTNLKPYHGAVETTVFTKEKDFTLQTMEGQELPVTVTEQEYLSGGKKIVVTAEGDKEVEIPGYYRSQLLVDQAEIPGLGYTTLQVKKGTEIARMQLDNGTTIENDNYQVTCNSQGELILKGKRSALTLENFLQFENVADAGDSYDFSPLPKDEPILLDEAELIHIEKSSLVQQMIVMHQAAVPADLQERKDTQEKRPLTVYSTIELRKGEDLIRIHHEMDNQARDHRLRALIQTPVKDAETSFGDQGYSIIERPVTNPRMETWREQGYKEAPVPIYTVEQFAGVESAEGHLTAFTKGIKEYEVIAESGQLALTLFRSVGLLGRDDLLWRPGRASGINNKVVTTPDAQMTGRMTFDYALYMENENVEEAALFRLADHYNDRYVSYQKQNLNTFEERLDRFEIPYPISELPDSHELAAIDNPNVFISAVKKAHDDDAIIVRLFNPSDKEETVTLASDYLLDQQLTNLAEEKDEKITASTVAIAPKSFQTVKLS
ncbi:glycoside hydrolase family 38 N-terminal domain-containing protein [Thalassobacillus sp. B23F22_16]|uniref:glycoside hydrolase family 38 N-terminal domain-containing protein n=1 Tax=Thalassobacillus sp. B23F22_16 TaxID=3459513 RepID=UPI00373F240B